MRGKKRREKGGEKESKEEVKGRKGEIGVDWCACALDAVLFDGGTDQRTDGPTDKAFLGVGYNRPPSLYELLSELINI